MALLETIEAKDLKVGYKIGFEGRMWEVVEVDFNQKSSYSVGVKIAFGKTESKRMTLGRKALVHVSFDIGGKNVCIGYVIHKSEMLLSALKELQVLEESSEESLKVIENVTVSKADIRKIVVDRIRALANECKNRVDGL